MLISLFLLIRCHWSELKYFCKRHFLLFIELPVGTLFSIIMLFLTATNPGLKVLSHLGKNCRSTIRARRECLHLICHLTIQDGHEPSFFPVKQLYNQHFCPISFLTLLLSIEHLSHFLAAICKYAMFTQPPARNMSTLMDGF